VEILFVAVTLNQAYIAEARSMTNAYKKIATKNGAIVSDAPLKLLSLQIKSFHYDIWLWV